MQTDRLRRPGLAALDDALAAGDVEGARGALLLLDAEERAILEAEMGPDSLARTYRHARSRRRGPGLGRVIVLPGLMGTELDSVDADGDSDLVWVNYFRIFSGRIKDMQLTETGDSAAPPPTIKPKQLYKKVYLPILLALQARWQTRPFPFDWRVDVDRSAAALAAEVRSWARGEPCHLVAHSMGGIVARRFIQKFPDVWASMQDPSGQGRGGRLIMMGTPNRGSYAIPLALTGEEKTVKSLDMLDFHHDRASLLRILNTFVGSYQLLPSPKLDLGGDDHKKLFDLATWGHLPVRQALLDRGKAFMAELDPVIDAGRLVFVGGYNQETPHRIHVEGPGRFRYESTLDGDGRVPHETGLLEGVATFWVVEAHGDLPKNAKVLAGIHDLLQKGTTAALETRRAAVRSARPSAPYDPRTKEAPDPEVDALAAWLKPSRTRQKKAMAFEEELAVARLEGLALRDGSASRRHPRRGCAASPRHGRGRRPRRRRGRSLTFASRWCVATSRGPRATCWSRASIAACTPRRPCSPSTSSSRGPIPRRSCSPSRRAGGCSAGTSATSSSSHCRRTGWSRSAAWAIPERSARRSCACSLATSPGQWPTCRGRARSQPCSSGPAKATSA
jgi:pimeloyl-ACP methyl ester carboxylesterase